MSEKVYIARTAVNGDNTSVDYSVYQLNINGTMTMTNDEFIKAISDCGYIGLGDFILEKLSKQLSTLIGKQEQVVINMKSGDMSKVDIIKVVNILSNKISTLEVEKAVLQAQLEGAQQNGEQDTKS